MTDGPNVHAEHQELADLIPWFVNGTIGEFERQRVDAHLLACTVCRDELSLERRIYEGMAAKPGVEYMPAASLKRLHAALNGLSAAAMAAEMPPVERRVSRQSVPWKGLAAASIGFVAVAITLMTADRWIQYRVRELPPNYHTVTTSALRAPDEVIRAVFAPTVTLVDLQAMLDEAQLRIISGPTEAGVYSLAATSDRSVSSSLALLRRHADVRFAESTQVSAAQARKSP
jgi:hypothetical protein